ncbi:MAG: carboxypeptidase regulatory-like domain-containing protein [Rikenellaceae bacterium]
MKKILLLMIAMVVSVASYAQVTTSGIGGQITDENGAALIGATVVAVHTPSGTEYGAATNASGNYAIQGMRPGGPYEVTISYLGYQTTTVEDVTLQLGETYSLQQQIAPSTQEISSVVVTTAKTKFNVEKTGATTNITSDQIMNIPTVSRSIEDIAKYSPYANGMGFAGGDGRSSNFTVDGANFNNNFGLSDDLPGGGTPISIDALEEAQIVIAPFDVRQTNFIGGGINAITKSGTNTFKGSAYTYFNNENMRGNKIDGVDLGDRDTDQTNVYGFTFGGPIVKDKLFFFTNVEYEKSPTTVVNWKVSEDGVSNSDNYISETSASQMELVKQHLIDEYGYNPGSYTDYPADETNMKILARLDWNINKDHKLALRYNYTKNKAWNATNGNSTNAAKRIYIDRIGYESMAFSNSLYSMDNIVSSFAADLNSRFGDKVSNQLLATYTNISDMRDSDSDPFPFIDILDGYDASGNVILEPAVSAGYELFTWNNGVNNTIFNIKDDVTYYAGAHKITAGLSFEHQMANNSYMRCGTGYYRYNSIEDFLSGAAPETVALTIGYDGETNPAAQVRFNQAGLYLQDDWNASDKFKLSAGIRFDNIYFNDEDIMTNNAVLEYDFGGKSIDTGIWPTANLQISPRVGFSWDVKGDGSMKLRGGSGIFTGRLPLVFFTNMPTNSNMVQNSQAITTTYSTDADGNTVATSDPLLANFAGGMITDVNELAAAMGMASTITPETATASTTIVGIDPDFKMPQVWKTSLALDYKLPTSFPFTATAEFMYTKNIHATMITNYDVMDIEDSWETFEGSDNRYIYPDDCKYYGLSGGASMLTNTSEGYGYTANITLNAQPATNLSVMLAYTRTESKEISGMPGSSAYSAWQSVYSVNGANNATLQRSQYVVPDRVIASVVYTLPYKSSFTATHLSLFYNGYSPYGNTYYYTNDMNGDGISYDLMYIPADKSDIRFVTPEDEAAYWAFADQDKYLSNHKGEYAEAYANRAPWVSKIDLRFTQDFFVNAGNTTHKLQLEANVLNIGNLLNSAWGVAKTTSVSNYGQILTYEGQDSEGYPTFSMSGASDGTAPTKTFTSNKVYTQAWSAQVGLRYYFN